MKTIYKYTLIFADEQEVQIPEGAEFLNLQLQRGNVVMWFLVDPENEKVTKKVATYGTGHPLRSEIHLSKYLGSYQLCDGDLVFHVFMS